MTLWERMEKAAEELAEQANERFVKSHSPKFDATQQTIFFNEASAYKNSAKFIRRVLKEHAMRDDDMEKQAEYGERDEHLVTDRKVCPLISAPVEGVDCVQEDCAWWTGSECAVVSMARGMGRQGIDVRITPPAVPGL